MAWVMAGGLQVCAEGFKVLAGTTCLQEVAVEALAPTSTGQHGGHTTLTSASFCDPYLLLRLSSGHAVLLCANPETGMCLLLLCLKLGLFGLSLVQTSCDWASKEGIKAGPSNQSVCMPASPGALP